MHLDHEGYMKYYITKIASVFELLCQTGKKQIDRDKL
jgi:hypothetical protein